MTFSSSTFSRYAGRWLLAMGLFELALAAAFVVGAVAIPEVGFGFLLTAVILGATGLVLVAIGLRVRRSAARADDILRRGIRGRATITGLTQTGMSLNDQPQIEIALSVTLPGRQPYPATRKEFVPLILIGRLVPGESLPVTVDPDDPSEVIIDWAGPAPAADPGDEETLARVQSALEESGLPAAAPFASPDQAGYTIEQLREVVRATGIDGTATIDKLADTGEVVGDERLFTMQVTLHVPGRPDQQLSPSAAMVPLRAVDKVAIGLNVPVKVHPENAGLVLFDWDRL